MFNPEINSKFSANPPDPTDKRERKSVQGEGITNNPVQWPLAQNLEVKNENIKKNKDLQQQLMVRRVSTCYFQPFNF